MKTHLGVGVLLALVAVAAPALPSAAVPVPGLPRGVAVNSITDRIYVSTEDPNVVSVVDGKTSRVRATIPVGSLPAGLAVNPNTNLIYVANNGSDSVSVIDGTTNRLLVNVAVGRAPLAVDVIQTPTEYSSCARAATRSSSSMGIRSG